MAKIGRSIFNRHGQALTVEFVLAVMGVITIAWLTARVGQWAMSGLGQTVSGYVPGRKDAGEFDAGYVEPPAGLGSIDLIDTDDNPPWSMTSNITAAPTAVLSCGPGFVATAEAFRATAVEQYTAAHGAVTGNLLPAATTAAQNYAIANQMWADADAAQAYQDQANYYQGLIDNADCSKECTIDGCWPKSDTCLACDEGDPGCECNDQGDDCDDIDDWEAARDAALASMNLLLQAWDAGSIGELRQMADAKANEAYFRDDYTYNDQTDAVGEVYMIESAWVPPIYESIQHAEYDERRALLCD